MSLKIACASDHGGFDLKDYLKEVLIELGHEVLDLGVENDTLPVDYPDYALKVVNALKNKEADLGLLVCGSGIGISIAANRHMGIRAALCHDVTSARLSRSHNNANILVLGGRLIGKQVAADCLSTFLSTSFEGGHHERRVEKLG